MSDTDSAASTITSSSQGVMPGVVPAAQVPSLNPALNPEAPAPQPIVSRTNAPENYFTADDVERIRREEKDKVYGRVEEMKTRLAQFEAEAEQRRQEEAAALAAAQDAARRNEESELSVRELLERKEQEWESRLLSEKQEREKAFALLEREREFAAIESYRQTALHASEEEILPELLEDVSGNTQEEIDASIARLKAKTASILENTTAALSQQRQNQPGGRVTAPPVGPLEMQTNDRQFTVDDIRNMSMDDFRKYRGSLGATGGTGNRGMFG